MEEVKRDSSSNKIKRSRNDQVKQVLSSYLQKRNIGNIVTSNLSVDNLIITKIVDGELSNPNSILYSCYNSDLVTIDHYFTKFVNWIKDVTKGNSSHRDLESIVGPLFCHLYLEILHGGHSDKATEFFKEHLSAIDRSKCDEAILELINALASDSSDLISRCKETFRLNKYKIILSPKSVQLLKRFVSEHSHVVFLQILQSWFVIKELTSEEIEGEEEKVPASEASVCNGLNDVAAQKLQDAMSALKKEIKPMFVVNLGNLKEDVSCGLIDKFAGLIAYSYDNSVFVRSLNSMKQLFGADDHKEVVFRCHKGRIYDVSLCREHNYIVTASHDKTLGLLNLSDCSLKGLYIGHEHPVYCTDISSNGVYVVSGSSDYTARLWSIETFTTLRLYGGHTQEITGIHFHSNCLYFGTSSADKTIRVWSIVDGTPCRLLYGSKGAVYSVAFSPCGKYIASAGEDKRLRVWDIASAKQFVEMKTGAEPIVHVAWSKDQSILSAGTVDGTIRNWDFAAIAKHPSDTNTHDPTSYVPLNSKLLYMQHTFDTFECLTVNTAVSTYTFA